MTREEAINIIRQYECCNEHIEACEMAIDVLQAEPIKRGTWRYYAKGNDKWAVCSECGIVSIVGGNYCPNCGAKMDGGKDEK